MKSQSYGNDKIEEALVSVIIPTFNRAATISQCVESILNQTYKNIEIIIVDDGSQDNTIEILEQIIDKRVKVISYTPNQGACHARNIGIANSRGEYIAFQDSDDFWHADKLEKQIRFIKKTKSDLVFCGMNRIDEIQHMRFYYPKRKINEKKDIHRQLLYENFISTQTMLLKREVCENIKFDEKIKKFQDWDYVLRASTKYKISYIQEALLDSTVQTNSISVSVSNYEALRVIYHKYYDEICRDSQIHSRFMYMAGKFLETSDKTLAAKYYKSSIKKQYNNKAVIKLMLLKINRN